MRYILYHTYLVSYIFGQTLDTLTKKKKASELDLFWDGVSISKLPFHSSNCHMFCMATIQGGA
jgi:hypothetical protein